MAPQITDSAELAAGCRMDGLTDIFKLDVGLKHVESVNRQHAARPYDGAVTT